MSPVTKIDDPKVQIRRHLRAKWQVANTMQILPTISTGWYDHNSKAPQVSVVFPDESPIAVGLHQSGGITQVRGGNLLIASFATKFSLAGNPPVELGAAPAKNLVYKMMQEADRIVTEAFTNDELPDFTKLEIGTQREPPPDMGQQPVVYRRHAFVDYDWIKVPA